MFNMNRVCERMIKYVGKHLIFRVWVSADQNFNVDCDPIHQLLNSFHDENNMKFAICELEKLENIAAVEILDINNNNGILLYPNWN